MNYLKGYAKNFVTRVVPTWGAAKILGATSFGKKNPDLVKMLEYAAVIMAYWSLGQRHGQDVGPSNMLKELFSARLGEIITKPKFANSIIGRTPIQVGVLGTFIGAHLINSNHASKNYGRHLIDPNILNLVWIMATLGAVKGWSGKSFYGHAISKVNPLFKGGKLVQAVGKSRSLVGKHGIPHILKVANKRFWSRTLPRAYRRAYGRAHRFFTKEYSATGLTLSALQQTGSVTRLLVIFQPVQFSVITGYRALGKALRKFAPQLSYYYSALFAGSPHNALAVTGATDWLISKFYAQEPQHTFVTPDGDITSKFDLKLLAYNLLHSARQGAESGAAFGFLMFFSRPILEPILHKLPIISKSMRYLGDTCGDVVLGSAKSRLAKFTRAPGVVHIHTFMGEEFFKEGIFADGFLKGIGMKRGRSAENQAFAETLQETITDFMDGRVGLVHLQLSNRLADPNSGISLTNVRIFANTETDVSATEKRLRELLVDIYGANSTLSSTQQIVALQAVLKGVQLPGRVELTFSDNNSMEMTHQEITEAASIQVHKKSFAHKSVGELYDVIAHDAGQDSYMAEAARELLLQQITDRKKIVDLVNLGEIVLKPADLVGRSIRINLERLGLEQALMGRIANDQELRDTIMSSAQHPFALNDSLVYGDNGMERREQHTYYRALERGFNLRHYILAGAQAVANPGLLSRNTFYAISPLYQKSRLNYYKNRVLLENGVTRNFWLPRLFGADRRQEKNLKRSIPEMQLELMEGKISYLKSEISKVTKGIKQAKGSGHRGLVRELGVKKNWLQEQLKGWDERRNELAEKIGLPRFIGGRLWEAGKFAFKNVNAVNLARDTEDGKSSSTKKWWNIFSKRFKWTKSPAKLKLGQFAYQQAAYMNRAITLREYFGYKFGDDHMLSIDEPSSAAPRGRRFSVKFDRQDILRDMPRYLDFGLGGMFGFKDKQFDMSLEVDYFLTRAEEGVDAYYQGLNIHRELRDGQAGASSKKLKHLAFWLTMRNRRQLEAYSRPAASSPFSLGEDSIRDSSLKAKIDSPEASNWETALSLGSIFVPITAEDIDNRIEAMRSVHKEFNTFVNIYEKLKKIELVRSGRKPIVGADRLTAEEQVIFDRYREEVAAMQRAVTELVTKDALDILKRRGKKSMEKLLLKVNLELMKSGLEAEKKKNLESMKKGLGIAIKAVNEILKNKKGKDSWELLLALDSKARSISSNKEAKQLLDDLTASLMPIKKPSGGNSFLPQLMKLVIKRRKDQARKNKDKAELDKLDTQEINIQSNLTGNLAACYKDLVELISSEEIETLTTDLFGMFAQQLKRGKVQIDIQPRGSANIMLRDDGILVLRMPYDRFYEPIRDASGDYIIGPELNGLGTWEVKHEFGHILHSFIGIPLKESGVTNPTPLCEILAQTADIAEAFLRVERGLPIETDSLSIFGAYLRKDLLTHETRYELISDRERERIREAINDYRKGKEQFAKTDKDDNPIIIDSILRKALRRNNGKVNADLNLGPAYNLRDAYYRINVEPGMSSPFWQPKVTPPPEDFIRDHADKVGIAKAARISKQALNQAVKTIVYKLKRAGQTRVSKKRFADLIREELKKQGADFVKFEKDVTISVLNSLDLSEIQRTKFSRSKNDPVVNIAPNSRRIDLNGDIVVVDFGAKQGLYNDDIARTFWVGKRPRKGDKKYALYEQYTKMYELALKLHDAAVQYIGKNIRRKGQVRYSEVQDAIDKVLQQELLLNKNRYALFYMESFRWGHYTGLEGHEGDIDLILPGMTITVEPMVGGIRAESTVSITKRGARLLTGKPNQTLGVRDLISSSSSAVAMARQNQVLGNALAALTGGRLVNTDAAMPEIRGADASSPIVGIIAGAAAVLLPTTLLLVSKIRENRLQANRRRLKLRELLEDRPVWDCTRDVQRKAELPILIARQEAFNQARTEQIGQERAILAEQAREKRHQAALKGVDTKRKNRLATLVAREEAWQAARTEQVTRERAILAAQAKQKRHDSAVKAATKRWARHNAARYAANTRWANVRAKKQKRHDSAVKAATKRWARHNAARYAANTRWANVRAKKQKRHDSAVKAANARWNKVRAKSAAAKKGWRTRRMRMAAQIRSDAARMDWEMRRANEAAAASSSVISVNELKDALGKFRRRIKPLENSSGLSSTVAEAEARFQDEFGFRVDDSDLLRELNIRHNGRIEWRITPAKHALRKPFPVKTFVDNYTLYIREDATVDDVHDALSTFVQDSKKTSQALGRVFKEGRDQASVENAFSGLKRLAQSGEAIAIQAINNVALRDNHASVPSYRSEAVSALIDLAISPAYTDTDIQNEAQRLLEKSDFAQVINVEGMSVIKPAFSFGRNLTPIKGQGIRYLEQVGGTKAAWALNKIA
ncbi:M24 family metallopeptidase, partial [Candidatus Omnitrophota bacterium]